MTDYDKAAAIIDASADHFGVRASAIRGRRRHKTLARARRIAMWLVREKTELSSAEIGRIFGRHHSTVLSACNDVRSEMRESTVGDWALVAAVQVRRAVDRVVRATQ